jgi:tripartite-type tricarboxylate transporter receptor subunit TctC
MKRVLFIVALFVAIHGFGVPGVIQAQPFPNRPIQLIHSGTPGQMMDIPCRIFADELAKVLGTQVIVTAKPGASHTLGVDFVVRSKKDGYTILYSTGTSLVYAPITSPEIVPYNPFKDLEVLGGQVILPYTISVQAESPWKTFAELVDYAKKNPGKLRFGAVGPSGGENFSREIIRAQTGAEFTLVPLSQHPAVSLLGGHIEVTATPISEVHSYAASGKIRILLLAAKMSKFPNIPTMTELGYSQDILVAWHAWFAPAGVPEESKKVLVPAIKKAMENPDVKAKIENLALAVDYKTPAEFRKLWEAEYQRGKEIAAKLGLTK